MNPFATLVLLAACSSQDPAPDGVVSIREETDRLVIELGGEPFTEYRYRNTPKPVLYPLYGPGGEQVVRDFPLRAGDADESTDHPHHQSVWFAHGAVNGHDFWQGAGERIVHESFLDSPPDTIRSRNLWQDPDGETICVEERTMTFGGDAHTRRIDLSFVLSPAGEPLVFGDTKEGTMALRLAPTLQLTGDVAQGHSLSSAGNRDGDCWGKRAAWVVYWGPIEGRTVSVALLDHPKNPRHPSWWHARDYGLFAANPFGVHDFEKKPPGTGDFTVPVGENLTLRYRLRIGSGEPAAAELDAELARFAAR